MKRVQKYQKYILFLVLLVILSGISVGYALYGKLLNISGNVKLIPDGQLEVLNVMISKTSNVISSDIPVIDLNRIEFNIEFGGTEDEFYAEYTMDIVNNSSYNYMFDIFNFDSTVNSSGGATGTLNLEVYGIEQGDIINPKETRTVTLKLVLDAEDPNQTYDAEASTSVETEKEKAGSLLVATELITNSVRSNSLAEFKLSIINSYEDDATATLSSANSNFVIVDSSRNPITSIDIPANDETIYTYYLMPSTTAVFTTDTASTLITVKSTKGNYNGNSMNLLVDISEEIDDKIPEIGSITITRDNVKGQATVSFSRLDSGGSSIVNYAILLYNSSNSLVKTFNTNSALTEYAMTGLSDGSYYVVVYGVDEAGNTGEMYLSSASTTNTYCRKSNTINLRWTFNITYSATNVNTPGDSQIDIGETYSATLTAPNGYDLPSNNNLSVKMGSTTLTRNNGYTYSNTTGKLSITNVTDDVTITASGTRQTTCLIEGTKIKLLNGYKNIEDITYDDLLQVWNLDNDSLTYAYPIWIEKEGVTERYQVTTFSDGTELKTTGIHGVFNVDLNRFVSVDDRSEFDIGTTVYKLENNKLKKIKVVDIKYVDEEVNYYHVVSTRYFDIFANDILTTDGTVMLSNFYGFEGNVKWMDGTKEMLSHFDKCKYEDLNIMPYFLFKGGRAEDACYLSNFGFTLDMFKEYLLTNQLNEEMFLEPNRNIFGKHVWKVTTSDNKYLSDYVMEGDYYTLKYPKNVKDFKYWYSPSNNEIYYPNDKVQINFGMYFEAIYE